MRKHKLYLCVIIITGNYYFALLLIILLYLNNTAFNKRLVVLQSKIASDRLQQIVSELSSKNYQELFYHVLHTAIFEQHANISDVILQEIIECSATFIANNHTPVSGVLQLTPINQDLLLITVLIKDLPFVLDSLLCLMREQELPILMVSHNTLDCLANKEFAINNTGEYLLVQIVVERHGDSNVIALQEYCDTTLACVQHAVLDWQSMLSLLKNASNGLNASVDKDYIALLDWLADNHMVLLGAAMVQDSSRGMMLVNDSKLGIFKHAYYHTDILQLDNRSQAAVIITKSDRKSIVHRVAHLDQIMVRKNDGYFVFWGLFTSSVYHQSAASIPLVKQKIHAAVESYPYHPLSYHCKELKTAIESFPRGELLRMSEKEVLDTAAAIVDLTIIPSIKIFLRQDYYSHFISAIVFIPEAVFSNQNRKLIESILCRNLSGQVSKRYINITDHPLVKLQLIIHSNQPHIAYDPLVIEAEIKEAVSAWDDKFQYALARYYTVDNQAKILYHKYINSFSQSYRNQFSGDKAVHDVENMERLSTEKPVTFAIYRSNSLLSLKIYSLNKELALSDLLPLIENFGFFAIEQRTYQVEKNGEDVFVHYFHLQDINIPPVNYITDALEQIWSGNIDDDIMNSLIVKLQATWQEVNMLRLYAKYLKQAGFAYALTRIVEAFSTHKELALKIIHLFTEKFSLFNTSDSIALYLEKLQCEIANEVQNAVFDKILKAYVELINATLRTNYYQSSIYENHPEVVLSVKLSSSMLSFLPLPKPFCEIYVYSCRFEAVHLRGGKIARGGLRWSNRHDDFRTEILGLMKAQMTKNSIIVPVGSKGGFVLKKTVGKNEAQEAVLCYQTFIASMLDITDNIVADVIVSPQGVKCYDAHDPYLVVAADKGTATFSDYANAISVAKNFWLGDAFASGGSAGYDHKKMAITARGAWVCFNDHKKAAGIIGEFTVVGVGDMSGDVFGNGMLLSPDIKLVAAFNHLSIFLDPNPNVPNSFAERQRLFNLPGSKWTDYNIELISKGGGVFSRQDKTIPLSLEMAERLNIQPGNITPDELIQAILQAPVDMLWNGGIGTYIKAEQESNNIIGDKANDNVRINGKQVRAKIICEGGNLGVTQLGRIEYAEHGGLLNTDFIDNSAGVDCSDHEVNLKIAFINELQKGVLTIKERDVLLSHMTEEVAALVLEDNIQQSAVISLEQSKSLSQHAWLLQHLVNRGELDAQLEKLPLTGQAMKDRQRNLTRPEIAVLLAYAKNSATNILLSHHFSADSMWDKYVINYFPKDFQTRFAYLAATHRLRHEIVVTVLVNRFINNLGIHFWHATLDQVNNCPVLLVKAFALAEQILNIEHLVSLCYNSPSYQIAIKKRVALQDYLQQIIILLLEESLDNVELLRNTYQPACYKILSQHTDIDAILAQMPEILNIFAVIKISKQHNYSIELVQQKWHEIDELLAVKQLWQHIYSFNINDAIVQSAICKMRKSFMRLHAAFVVDSLNGKLMLTETAIIKYKELMDNLSQHDPLACLTLIIDYLDGLR